MIEIHKKYIKLFTELTPDKIVLFDNLIDKNIPESDFFKFKKWFNKPVALSSVDMSALAPPISVLTHPGWYDETIILLFKK